MSDELSARCLDADLAEVRESDDAERWELTRPGELEIYATLSPLSDPGESFQARLLWTLYPGSPPSLKFRDQATGRLDLPHAWPKVGGFRPTSHDACVNWTQEGFALHPEWQRDPHLRWDPTGNVLLRVLRTTQDGLDLDYHGRHP